MITLDCLLEWPPPRLGRRPAALRQPGGQAKLGRPRPGPAPGPGLSELVRDRVTGKTDIQADGGLRLASGFGLRVRS
jgi:hypothetical protein